MRLLIGVWVAACMLSSASAADPKPPEVKVPMLSKAPKIDGVLDDASWKEAATSDAFKLADGDKPKAITRMMLGQDAENLYIAIVCYESADALKALKNDITDHDADSIWDDDSIELFIDPSGARGTYYQLIVNSKGTTWDAWVEAGPNSDMNWEPKYEAKTKVGADSWVLEMALPWSSFNRTTKSAADWVFNVSRTRSLEGETIYWSPVYSSTSHTPEKFGKLLGLPEKSLKAPDQKK